MVTSFMTAIEQHILDIIQDAFPIVSRPYAEIAGELSILLNRIYPQNSGIEQQITEQYVYEVVENLRDKGVIRRIGAIYDSRKLGYISRLCAGIVPTLDNGAADDSALEEFASIVMNIPLITHNYVRSHEYNVWFTIIAKSENEIFSTIHQLEQITKLRNVHCLSATQMFKINTVMGHKKNSRSVELSNDIRITSLETSKSVLTKSDEHRIRLLSKDIPHSITPFVDLCKNSRCSLDDLIDGVQCDLSLKRMRRFGAVLRHQKAGFAHNAMVCFGVKKISSALKSEDAFVLEIGNMLALNPRVSHCYARPPFEGFPYSIYAMFHATSAENLNEAIVCAANTIQEKFMGDFCLEYVRLDSIRELKKTSFNFFDV